MAGEEVLHPKSQISIHNYFQKSRIVYGMNCYLDMKSIADKVENSSLLHTKAILVYKRGRVGGDSWLLWD
jgi:hypothetical protein